MVERFQEELAARRPTLAAQLAHADLTVAGNTLEIANGQGDNLVASALARAANRDVLDSAVAAVFGAGARWRPRERAAAARPGNGGAGPQGADPAAAADAAPGLVAHPRVQAVLEIFGGSVAGVEVEGGTRRERDRE
jgi:hypothetical protein